MTLPSAHKCVLRTIRVLDSINSTLGSKTQEVISACENIKFKNIQIYSKSSVIKILLGQLFTSLSNNMKQRLMTTQASNVSSREVNNEYQVQFNKLIADLEVLSPENWADHIFSMVMKVFGVYHKCFKLMKFYLFEVFVSIKKIKINIGIKPLMTVINSIAISSSECEHTFSSMNIIVSPTRSKLISSHLSLLIFNHCVWPPLENLDPKSFVSWIIRGKRSATETNCLKRTKKDSNESNSFNSIWKCVNV